MPIFSIKKPSTEVARRLIAAQTDAPFSYEKVGATGDSPPAGFVVDHTRVRLGSGEVVFQAARAALLRWEQFQLGWVDVAFPETPLEPGKIAAVMGRGVGLWWLNLCRIVYVVDESGPICKFGFAYGTLPYHVEKGEERFLLEWHQKDDSVWYDILAFSRSNHLFTKIGYPLVRRLQKKFGRDSAAAMRRAATKL